MAQGAVGLVHRLLIDLVIPVPGSLLPFGGRRIVPSHVDRKFHELINAVGIDEGGPVGGAVLVLGDVSQDLVGSAPVVGGAVLGALGLRQGGGVGGGCGSGLGVVSAHIGQRVGGPVRQVVGRRAVGGGDGHPAAVEIDDRLTTSPELLGETGQGGNRSRHGGGDRAGVGPRSHSGAHGRPHEQRRGARGLVHRAHRMIIVPARGLDTAARQIGGLGVAVEIIDVGLHQLGIELHERHRNPCPSSLCFPLLPSTPPPLLPPPRTPSPARDRTRPGD